jgi:hypothetical protein
MAPSHKPNKGKIGPNWPGCMVAMKLSFLNHLKYIDYFSGTLFDIKQTDSWSIVQQLT